jgi:hypothetical protein
MVVTLCGSRKFEKMYDACNYQLSLEGIIILSVGGFRPQEMPLWRKVVVDKLHFDKIKMSDAVLIINVDGYIGESTKNEIAYAQHIGVPVMYLRGMIKHPMDWEIVANNLREAACQTEK